MDLFKAMGISASGLNAQRVVINGISMNLANVQTTRAEGGEPYRRRRAILSQTPADMRFSDVLLNRLNIAGHLSRTHLDHFPVTGYAPWESDPEKAGVRAELIEEMTDYKKIHDPSHPDADAAGYVLLPNINSIEEMVHLLMAVRNYEANVTAFNAAKNMAMKALEIGR
jgi:flagellar basal-body rod protein FlgC